MGCARLVERSARLSTSIAKKSSELAQAFFEIAAFRF